MNKKEALWIFFKAVFYFKSELFISPVRNILRCSHGKRTTGIFITISSSLMMIGFNAKTSWGVASNLMPFLSHVLPFLMDGDAIEMTVFNAIHSRNLMYFWMTYLVISSMHLVMISKRKRQIINPVKRGTSWLYSLIFRHLNLSENSVQLIIEPLVVFTVGYGLKAYDIDPVFGVFLMICAAALFIQELQDSVIRYSLSYS